MDERIYSFNDKWGIAEKYTESMLTDKKVKELYTSLLKAGKCKRVDGKDNMLNELALWTQKTNDKPTKWRDNFVYGP